LVFKLTGHDSSMITRTAAGQNDRLPSLR